MIIGITGTDGAGKGEKVWVSNAGSIAQGSLRFFGVYEQKIQRVDSFCKKTFARPSTTFYSNSNELIDEVVKKWCWVYSPRRGPAPGYDLNFNEMKKYL